MPTPPKAPAQSSVQPLVRFRAYQAAAFWRKVRRLLLLWARQRGKSYTLAAKALLRMMEQPDWSCFFVSASIPLGTEFVRKEAQIWQDVLSKFRQLCADKGYLLDTSADKRLHGRATGELLDVDAIAEIFEAQKLEARIWHSRSVYSRSIVIAANPATAVGWTGDIFMDEVGRIPDLQEVCEAVQPFMSSNPQFIWWMATTPPPDDAHYSFEMFLPPVEQFAVNAAGNWYTSKSRIPCHRVDAWDGVAAGVPLYDDDTGAPLSPEEHRARAFDKTGWDRNFALRFVRSGAAAVSYQALQRAFALGRNQCAAAAVTEEVAA